MAWGRAAALSFVLLLPIVNGCGSEVDGRVGGGAIGPTLVLLDSILLPDSDSLVMGNPWTPMLDPYDGGFYIPDGYYGRVYRFDRSGSLVRTYGRPGRGPGELQGPTMAFVLDDSTLAVRDGRLGRLKRYHRGTGEALEEHVFTAFVGQDPPVFHGGKYWFAGTEQGRARALVSWDPVDGGQTLVGLLPEEYYVSAREGISYANHMLGGALTWADSTFVRGWYIRNDLMRYTPEGEVVDTIHLPVAHRFGVPENLRYMYDIKGPRGAEKFTFHSYLRHLHTLPDGGLAFIHHDQELESFEGPVPVFSATSWLGVLSPDFSRACVDALVPSSPDTRPMEAFRGDTLFVFDRRIVDEARLESRIRLYRVDTTGCDWLPVE